MVLWTFRPNEEVQGPHLKIRVKFQGEIASVKDPQVVSQLSEPHQCIFWRFLNLVMILL